MQNCHQLFLLSPPKNSSNLLRIWKTLFQELKQIRDMAKKSIQDTQKSQKKQYDKSSHPVTIKAGDTVFVKVQPKFNLDRNYHGPYRVYEATDTNVKVKPVSSPYAESIITTSLKMQGKLFSKSILV